METFSKNFIPVTLNGGNYLLWSRLAQTALGGRGLWSYVTGDKYSKDTVQGEDGIEVAVGADGKWAQKDLMTLSIIQSSLEPSILEAYSHCESSKELWNTLKKVYGNLSNLSRVFEVKLAINNLRQEGEEFNQHLGRFRSLWSELKMLRPSSCDPEVLKEREEQDAVFSLLLTLDTSYNQLWCDLDQLQVHVLEASTRPRKAMGHSKN